MLHDDFQIFIFMGVVSFTDFKINNRNERRDTLIYCRIEQQINKREAQGWQTIIL